MKKEYDLTKIAFKDEKKFLSNMYPSTIVFKLNHEQEYTVNNVCKLNIRADGIEYRSSEHLYQSLKSNNPEWKKLVLSTDSGEKVKSLARKHLGKDFAMREDWNSIKVEVMRIIVTLKFDQNIVLKHKLLSIEEDIAEENCWGDTFWGTVDGIGDNNLGKILMEYRCLNRI